MSCRCKAEKQSESQVQQVAEAAENPNKIKTNRDQQPHQLPVFEQPTEEGYNVEVESSV